MKVTWQTDDVKAGIQVGRYAADTNNVVLAVYVEDVGPRYTLAMLDKGNATSPVTREKMAELLTELNYVPTALLTL